MKYIWVLLFLFSPLSWSSEKIISSQSVNSNFETFCKDHAKPDFCKQQLKEIMSALTKIYKEKWCEINTQYQPENCNQKFREKIPSMLVELLGDLKHF